MWLPRSLLEHDAMISHHIFILTQDRPDDTKKGQKARKKWYSRLDKCDGLSEIFFTKMGHFSYILLTGESRGDKHYFSFSSQQVEARGLEVHISIFLYFTRIWSRPAARRERSFISAGREDPDAPRTSPLSGWQLNYCRDLFSLKIFLLHV